MYLSACFHTVECFVIMDTIVSYLFCLKDCHCRSRTTYLYIQEDRQTDVHTYRQTDRRTYVHTYGARIVHTTTFVTPVVEH